MELFKILAICFIAAVFAMIFRKYKPEYAFVLVLVAAVIVIFSVLGTVMGPINLLRQRLSENGIDSGYFAVALKALGIGYITDFIADACRDSGQASLAAKAELAGKCAIFVLSVPLLIAVFETAVGFIR